MDPELFQWLLSLLPLEDANNQFPRLARDIEGSFGPRARSLFDAMGPLSESSPRAMPLYQGAPAIRQAGRSIGNALNMRPGDVSANTTLPSLDLISGALMAGVRNNPELARLLGLDAVQG